MKFLVSELSIKQEKMLHIAGDLLIVFGVVVAYLLGKELIGGFLFISGLWMCLRALKSGKSIKLPIRVFRFVFGLTVLASVCLIGSLFLL